MVKIWHVVLIAGLVLFIATIISVESGAVITPYYYLPIIFLGIVGAIVYFGYKLLSGKNVNTGTKRTLRIDDVKFIVANHLFKSWSINIFTEGQPVPSSIARYTMSIEANRCFPTRNEEAWWCPLTINDRRYFNGILTRMIIYIDSSGSVVGDPYFNDMHKNNSRYWTNPELFFMQGPSKTANPRTISQIMAEKFEETGELPKLPLQQEKEEKDEE